MKKSWSFGVGSFFYLYYPVFILTTNSRIMETVKIVGTKAPLEVGKVYEESEVVADACIKAGVAKMQGASAPKKKAAKK